MNANYIEDGQRIEIYYSVDEILMMREPDPANHLTFHHSQKFGNPDLLKARQRTFKYYKDRLKGVNKSQYFLGSPLTKTHVMRENDLFLISIYFVITVHTDSGIKEEKCSLLDNDPVKREEAELTELAWLRKLGLVD